MDGIWYDSTFRQGRETIQVTFLTEEYFALIVDHPALARYLSLGDRVVVDLDGVVYEILAN